MDPGPEAAWSQASRRQRDSVEGAVILVVDDSALNRQILDDQLRGEGFIVVQASNGQEALEYVERLPPDVILLDAMMPGIDGFEVARRLKAHAQTRLIPIIMITALTDQSHKILSIEAGADHFISKPFDRAEVRARVHAVLRLKRLTDELESAENIIFALARAVRAKDVGTEAHTMRVTALALEMGQRLSVSPDELEDLEKASILHDIGKIAIPDAVLNKPGPLNEAEWDLMKKHTLKGVEICRPLRALRGSLPIIRWHHERLDGSGYPDGLIGDQIPVTARIMAVVDIYDALESRRPYKPPFSREKCISVLREGVENGWWDGRVVEALVSVLRQRDATAESATPAPLSQPLRRGG
ncbi:MAG: response regulator [Gemmatimonadetes bacterium]|nr:response regulator [Gemmatimonadota bacterium]